jgi:superfamily II DNA or RNA helicase
VLNTTTTHLAAAIRRANIQYRDYQQTLVDGIYASWANGAANVLAVLPTGGGKTVVFAGILAHYDGFSCAVAHRQELVSQISIALARNHVRHRIIAPSPVIRRIVQMQIDEVGASYYDPNSRCAVAGVDTLVKREDDATLTQWRLRVGLWVQDEAHHVLKANKWGKACAMFPNARGLGVTATPFRADGKGLGRDSDGLFDVMVEGPTMRELILRGFLTDYRIVCAESDIDLSDVAVSETTGDYNPQQLKAAVRRSHIIGDVVRHYQKFTPGKLAVVFATDVETATDITAKFNAAGIAAEVVSAKTPDNIRAQILRRFKNRELLVLVNVDLFGEGFDLPSIETVIFARPTESLSLYIQQFGRALRPMEGKARAWIIDHVGNIVRHGLPDKARVLTLEPREKRSTKKRFGEVPLKPCLNIEGGCGLPYEAYLKACPYCGHKPEPAGRSSPDFVDGDLIELDAETLAKMRGEVQKIDGPAYIPKDATPEVAGAIKKRHKERQTQQTILREIVRWWAGIYQARGYTDSECYRLFFFRFGIDVLSAQALGKPEAAELAQRVAEDIGKQGVAAA